MNYVCIKQLHHMKTKQILAYILLAVQCIALVIAVYMLFDFIFSSTGLLKRPRTHLMFQLLLNTFVILGTIRFIKIKNQTEKMRKQARDQRLARSKSVELLIFILLVSIIFLSLYFTYPTGRYMANHVEVTVYIITLVAQFILVAQLVTIQSDNSKNSKRTAFRFSAAGAVIGLLFYFTYYMMMK